MQHNLPSETSGFVTNSNFTLSKMEHLGLSSAEMPVFSRFRGLQFGCRKLHQIQKTKKTRSRCVILQVWKAELGCSSIQIDSSQIWTLGGPGKLTHLMLRRYPVLFQRFWRDQLKNEKFKEFLNRLGGGYCCWTTSWWASKAPPPIQPMHTKWRRAGRRNAQPIYGNAGKKCLGPLWCRLKYPCQVGFIQPGKQVAIIEVLAH